MYLLTFLIIFCEIILKIFFNNKFIFLYLPLIYFFYINQNKNFFTILFVLSFLNDIYLFLPIGFTGSFLFILFFLSNLVFKFFEKDNLFIILIFLAFIVISLIGSYFIFLDIQLLSFLFFKIVILNLIISFIIFFILLKISKNEFI